MDMNIEEGDFILMYTVSTEITSLGRRPSLRPCVPVVPVRVSLVDVSWLGQAEDDAAAPV